MRKRIIQTASQVLSLARDLKKKVFAVRYITPLRYRVEIEYRNESIIMEIANRNKSPILIWAVDNEGWKNYQYWPKKFVQEDIIQMGSTRALKKAILKYMLLAVTEVYFQLLQETLI